MPSKCLLLGFEDSISISSRVFKNCSFLLCLDEGAGVLIYRLNTTQVKANVNYPNSVLLYLCNDFISKHSIWRCYTIFCMIIQCSTGILWTRNLLSHLADIHTNWSINHSIFINVRITSIFQIFIRVTEGWKRRFKPQNPWQPQRSVAILCNNPGLSISSVLFRVLMHLRSGNTIAWLETPSK